MKVALYTRVSSDAQDVSLSIGAQMRALREYCEKHGHTIVREFVDEAESGRTSARPAFREMIALAKTKEPPFEAILVWKLNRFARNRVDSITFKELLSQRGIKVISINEPLENNPSGKLLEGIIESIDEFYSANLGQDIKRGLREAAERGFFVGSRPPDGFHKIDVVDGNKTRHKLEPDSPESNSVRIVKRIFATALQGNGTKEIAMALNKDGLRTSTGARWTKTYVHKILTNEAYCGTLVLGGRPGHKAIHSGEPPIRKENAWLAIIDRETFDLIQENMAARRPVAVHPRVLPSFYLLSGILRCSCGRAMIGRSAKSHRFYYYTCNRSDKQGKDACSARSLPKRKLEQMVIEHVKSKILTDEVLMELVVLVNEDLDSANTVYKEKLETVDTELHDVNSRLAKLYDALETGQLNMNDLAPRIRELRVQQDGLLKTRVIVEAEMTLHGVQHVDAEQVKTYASDLRSLLTETDIARSKRFLRTFVEKIMIHGETGTIYYKLPVPSHWKETEEVVLPTVPPSGAGGIRTLGSLKDSLYTFDL
jgi:DNA invertase Pin-like site-specific DNA recombinase